MDDIAAWISRITFPLVTRVMASLGLGTVTYAGADTALDAALNQIRTAFLGFSGDILALLAMSGFFDAMSIMSGGIVSGLAWLTLKHFALQTTGNQS
jgi:hypothetical protein